MNFRDFVRVLEAAGFQLVRQSGSHRTYEGFVDDLRRVVTVACHRESDDIRPGTLASMIRQSGTEGASGEAPRAPARDVTLEDYH